MNKTTGKRQASEVVTFKKWGRKGYSVFSSLHKVLRIGSLGVMYLLHALPSNAATNLMDARRDTLDLTKDTHPVGEVVVSAQRAPVTFSQVARVVTVIGKDEIEAAPVQSIQDLLEYALNVDVRQRGNFGVQADVSIRGGSFDQVLILLNGINITDPQTGHHNLNLPISLDAVERIEILEGPASRVYGPNAFSGAINIITGTSDHSNVKVRAAGGQHGYYNAGLSGTWVSKHMKNFVAADYRKSDGYISNTDFNIGEGFYEGKIMTNAGNLEIQTGYTNRGFGANSFYTPAFPNQYERIKTTFASAKMETGKVVHFTPSVYWRRNQDKFELFRGMVDAPSWYTQHNYHLTDVYGTNLNAWFTSPLGKTAFGSDFRSENIWSTVLGKEMDKPINVPGEDGIQFTKSDSRTNFSIFLEHSVYLKNWMFSAGLMTNWNSQLGMKWNLYPGADISWNFSKIARWYASVNKSLRMPTFTDLYYSSPTNVGNPDLKPEEATTLESGIKLEQKGLIGHVSWFHRWGKNMIDWVHQPNETVWHAENLTKINTDGIEFSARVSLDQLLGQKTFLHYVEVSYAWMNQNKQSGIYASRYVLDYMKNKLDIGISHAIWNHFGANWQFSYQDRNGAYTQWTGTGYGQEVDYKPFWLADARLYWKKKGTNIYMGVSNLLDRTYYDFGNLVQPGRWIRFGIMQQIDL
ncbi:TonB-dependent receptor plug domain-containing protein [Prolixibacter denitrificans]|uniref:Iron complex outermembrane receptor protein n=1 Tax=Prolixibacter denitrificans TaxID=1541063 RepID=A0A2P8CAL8_9BACT|nr:TonB-dependent receptor [Prolixibacter denitrificans]PSK81972.1 iron complex outermembrane receptor protein [Prolixibacter denitrificans]GET22569.1 hypothetical protein JCM18694_28150 [Prolixibacter denitrificans]